MSFLLIVVCICVYILISVWVYKCKKDLNKNTWFVVFRRYVPRSSVFIWPVSMIGHILWITCLLSFPLFLFLSSGFNSPNARFMIVSGLIITFGLLIIAGERSEGYVFSKKARFNSTSSIDSSANYGSLVGFVDKPVPPFYRKLYGWSLFIVLLFCLPYIFSYIFQ